MARQKILEALPKFKARMPTAIRFLCEDAAKEAFKVFGGSLDLTKILISNGIGRNGRAATGAVDHPDGWHVVLNLGDLSSWATTPRRRCDLIHELTHAWQSQTSWHGQDHLHLERSRLPVPRRKGNW
jgi:hypothetical protein